MEYVDVFKCFKLSVFYELKRSA